MSELSILDFYKRYIGLPVRKGIYLNMPNRTFKSGLKINTIKDVVFDERINRFVFTFKEDDSDYTCEDCEILPEINIKLFKLERLYPGCEILGVEEIYIPVFGWVKPYMYKGIKIRTLIKDCIFQNATTISFQIKHEGEIKAPDYKVSELVTKSKINP